MLLKIWHVLMVLLAVGIAGYAAHFLDFVPKDILEAKGALIQEYWYLAIFYGHVIFGIVALLSGMTQFFKKLRARRLNLHRNLGKAYVVACIISSICGFSLAFHAEQGWATGSSFVIMASLWFGFTVMAWRTIQARQIAEHRVWMLRSYAMCFTAVSLRLWLGVFTGLVGWDFSQAYIWSAWFCWIPNLIIIELYIRATAKATPVAVQPAV